MTKRGRKSKYETHVKPYLSNISKWAQECTERQIAQKLNVGYSNFIKYKNEFEELKEALKSGHNDLVDELRSSLIKKAKGFYYDETKVVTEHVDLPEHIKNFLIENGLEIPEAHIVKTEVSHKYATPDVAAINLALKNYDRDNWSNDPQMLEIRKKELELREKQIESNNW